MKLYIEVTIGKTDGPTCSEEDVFAVVEESLDGESLYPQNPDKDDESSYEVQQVRLLPIIYPLAAIKDGTGWSKGAKFVQVSS